MPHSLYHHILSLLHQSCHLSHLKQIQAFLYTSGHGHPHAHGHASPLLSFQILRFASLSLADLPYARRILDSLPSPNVYHFTALLTAYSLHSPSSAPHLFVEMLRRRRPRPNEFIYPLVLKSCRGAAFAESVHAQFLKSGFGAHSVVKTALLDACCRFSDLAAARKLFDELGVRNVVSWTALVSGYARVGKMGFALSVFEDMPEKDVPAWNAIVAGCAQNGLFPEAVRMFRRMFLSGLFPNSTSVSCVLSACGHLGLLRMGKWVHGYVLKNRLADNSFAANALVDMYGKCGSLKEARWVFNGLSEKSLTVWNSLINGLAIHGHSESAMSAFTEMELGGLVPDEVTFVGILNACTHGGLVDEGLRYFESIDRDYGIDPTIEHYGCVIDLLGRAGRFKAAMEIVRDMRIEPDEVVWGSLLSGCRTHGNAELAKFAVEKLLEIDPTNAGYGIMLANLYSEGGKWEEVRKVRKGLRESGGKKLPGCSWIEADSEFRQFYSGDTLHDEAEEIREVLEGLVGLMEARR